MVHSDQVPNRQSLDSDCEVAAVVYGPADDPDALLSAFASSLMSNGYCVAGVIQRGGVRRHASLSLKVLPSNHEIWIADPFSTRAVDATRLTLAGLHVRRQIAMHKPDVALLNRFGRLEERGLGLCCDILNIAHSSVPLLVPVAEARFDAWNRFAGGMAVKLACRMDHLQTWWRRLACDLSGTPRPPPSMCFQWK